MRTKKRLKELDKKVNELVQDKDLLVNQLRHKDKELLGYYNLETELNKSAGVVTRNKDETELIRFILEDRIKLTMFAMFEYEGLPDYIPSYMIEHLLYHVGYGLMWDVADKFYVGNYIKTGAKLDEYRRPVDVRPVFMNGRNSTKRTVNKDCVVLRNTFTQVPTSLIVKPFLNRLALNYEALSRALKTSMTKWGLVTNADDLPNVRKALEKMLNEDGYFAYIPQSLQGSVERLDFFEEFKGSEYWEDFNSTLNLMYNQLGISTNTSEDKKERLVVDEVNIGNLKVGVLLESMIRSRYEFVQEINKTFDLSIKLKVKLQDMEETQDDDGGMDNDDI